MNAPARTREIDRYAHGLNDPDFLDYYAGILEREAAARPGQDVQWMIDGAARARYEAEQLRIPVQANLFKGRASA